MIETLQAGALHAAYERGEPLPAEVVAEVYDRIEARGDDGVWIEVVPREVAIAAARALRRHRSDADLPALHGLPFAVKDNIDVAGLPTTAACPGFAYLPDRDADVVARVLAAGAVLIGKTNLDQFATGLSGTRSPYGIVANPFDPQFIAGGSSSGSAVAVAAGLVTFALGTDTAGSGRVPAGLTGTVGVKPTPGLVSTAGIVPACASLDCPSVFALSVADGGRVLGVIAPAYPSTTEFSVKLTLADSNRPMVVASDHRRAVGAGPRTGRESPGGGGLGHVRVGVPADLDVQRAFGGDPEAADLFAGAVSRMRVLGATVLPFDLDPFLAVGRMLYDGPWLAERLSGLREFLASHPEQVHPVIRAVLADAERITGADVFAGFAQLRELKRSVESVWQDADMLLVPTIPSNPRIETLLADAIGANARLGRYTSFVNLLGLAAVAVPSDVSASGVPVGVTLIGPGGSEALLLDLAASWQQDASLPVSVRGDRLLVRQPASAEHASAEGDISLVVSGAAADEHHPEPGDGVRLVVVGAHLSGQPLNPQLVGLGASCESTVTTAAEYRLFDLSDAADRPTRPGLLRVTAGGAAIEAEVYRISSEGLGRLVTGIPAPLGIGTVRLADGSQALGFLCESAGVAGCPEITAFGGWRAYLSRAAGGGAGLGGAAVRSQSGR